MCTILLLLISYAWLPVSEYKEDIMCNCAHPGLPKSWSSLWWPQHFSSLCLQDLILREIEPQRRWWGNFWGAFIYLLDIYYYCSLQVCFHCDVCWWQWGRYNLEIMHDPGAFWFVSVQWKHSYILYSMPIQKKKFFIVY